ncbi:MAG: TrpR-like protein [Oscillospiraceae bacterium]|nr:TrpR-like protein [Oscillospiraceae bacterium]
MNNRNKRSDPNCELYRALTLLKTPEEFHKFFLDLCTLSELNAIEQRYEVAKMLHADMIYNEILAKTSASSATISRVNRSLMNGEGAYEMVFERIKEQQ